MERQILDNICRQIYSRFPEVRGCKPKVRSYAQNQSLLIFEGKSHASDGHAIPRTVRVVVNASGKIAKVTTSR